MRRNSILHRLHRLLYGPTETRDVQLQAIGNVRCAFPVDPDRQIDKPGHPSARHFELHPFTS